ncbi:MAG: nitronate monooxygenase [Rhodospirillaceae bacterium]|nr:nitronate monooxygenase [Rhodospirillaceae bacterium]MBT5034567.1 nitronate monooxygenase [Rhodospirillaceae bacterium]MBT6221202.1 nitronate monooxygenase [Rhodospirillaceae bacterium]MBT6364138.1 nitronate monooxygenase [Rhodospirillaceae bacterium]MBT7770855.1 nitronate monooxygenase [Rhodospirillales bacterium]
MKTRLTDLFDISVPIIQAPMAGVSTPELAAAVCNAGALGSLALGGSNAAAAEPLIKAVRAGTNRPFNVNFFCHETPERDTDKEAAWIANLAPQMTAFGGTPPATLDEIYTSFNDNDDMLDLILAEKPAILSFHFGLPEPKRLQALKATGALILATVTTPAEALAAAAAGIDAVIAQGHEAGGHRGVFDPSIDQNIGTFALLPLIRNTVDIPVIAAGGVMNGAGIAAALMLGADGAQLGTAFIACPETVATNAHRALLESGDTPTEVTTVVSGRPARGFTNEYMKQFRSDDERIPAFPIAYDANKSFAAAAKNAGESGYGTMWAGQAAALSQAMPAAELVEQLTQETIDEVRRLTDLVGAP